MQPAGAARTFVVGICVATLGRHVDKNGHLASKLFQGPLMAIDVSCSLQTSQ
jgi:hypothetical protein